MSLEQRIAAIQKERGQVWHQANTFLDEINKRSDPRMNEEERTQWQRYNEDLDQLEADGDELVQRHELETERGQVREAQGIVFGEPNESRELQTTAADLRSWIRGEKRMDATDFEGGGRVNGIYSDFSRVQRERDLVRMGASPDEVRALAWDTGSVASAVPTLFDRYLYEVMEESVSAFRMPMRRINTDSGASMEFPKVASHAIATQVAGQGTTIGGTDPTFAKLTLTPVKYGELIALADEVVNDTGVDIVEFVARDIGRAVGRRVNEAVMATVNAAVFTGAAGTASTGGSLIGPTFSNLVDVEYSINDEYRSASSVAWLFRDKTTGSIRKLRDGAGGTEGAPLWQPSLTGGIAGIRTPSTLFGYPVFTDPSIASMASNAKIGYFGDWSSYFFRTVGGNVLVERNDSVGFATDQVYFRGKMRAASGAQDLTAINLLKQSV